MSAAAPPSTSETLAAAGIGPAAPPKPAFDEAAHEASVKAKFEELGGKPTPTLAQEAPYPWEKKEPAAPDKGAPDKGASEAKPEAAKDQKAPPQGDTKAPDRDTREKIALAKTALGRTGLWTSAEMEALSVDVLIQKGEKAAKKQAADDKAYAALKGNKQPPPASGDTTGADTTSPGRSGAEESTVAQTGQPPADDIDRLIEAGEITEEQGKRIKAMHRSADEKVQQATRLVAQTRISAAQSKLVEKFPDLANPEGRDKVLQWMAKHDPQGQYVLGDDVEAFERYFESACWVEWGPEIGRVTREQMLKGNQTTRDGQPDHAAPRATDPATLSADERKKLYARAAEESGGDEAAFNATLARLGLPKP